MACAEWITKHHGETIGIASADGPFLYWGFASETEGWEMAVRRGTAEEVIREAIKTGILQDGGLNLVMRDARATVPVLSSWLGISVQEIASRVTGDVTALTHATGRSSKASWAWAADDAYDALVTEKHWKTSAPPYYTAVGIPRALSSFSGALEEDAEGLVWRISYNDLLLKVVAHYTREPVMVRAFMDEEDPVPRMGELLGIEGPSVTYAVLVWSALNWDTIYVQQHHPDVFTLLPDDLDTLRLTARTKLAVLSLGLSSVSEDYTQSKGITSLWGRTFQWGTEAMGQVYEHRFMGSVSDMVDLLVVSLQQNLGGSVSVEEPAYSPANRIIIIKGRIEPVQEKYDLLKSAANLSNPLGVPLNPSIIIGD